MGNAYKDALQKGSVEALNAFIEDYADSGDVRVEEAKEMVEDLMWQKAAIADTPKSFENYLKRCPYGCVYKKEARSKGGEALWRETVKKGAAADYLAYAESCPALFECLHLDEAREKAAEAEFEDLKKRREKSAVAWEAFVEKYPASTRREAALGAVALIGALREKNPDAVKKLLEEDPDRPLADMAYRFLIKKDALAAKKAKSADAWRAFMERWGEFMETHPWTKKYKKFSAKMLLKHAWEETGKQKTFEAYDAFRREFAESPKAAAAQAQAEKLLVKELEYLKAEGSPAAFEEFVKKAEGYGPAQEAADYLAGHREEIAYRYAMRSFDPAAQKGFLSEFPASAHKKEVKKRLKLTGEAARIGDALANPVVKLPGTGRPSDRDGGALDFASLKWFGKKVDFLRKLKDFPFELRSIPLDGLWLALHYAYHPNPCEPPPARESAAAEEGDDDMEMLDVSEFSVKTCRKNIWKFRKISKRILNKALVRVEKVPGRTGEFDDAKKSFPVLLGGSSDPLCRAESGCLAGSGAPTDPFLYGGKPIRADVEGSAGGGRILKAKPLVLWSPAAGPGEKEPPGFAGRTYLVDLVGKVGSPVKARLKTPGGDGGARERRVHALVLDVVDVTVRDEEGNPVMGIGW